ncbi:GrpB family protein [Curtobacterium flaccumfaciens]|nr:GrpB family protein [Curtobacterium flaccumfaciens]
MSRAYSDVTLVSPQRAWSARFAETASELQAVFRHATIEHIGSTSVPGLSSKDTIDVAVGVLSAVDALDRETLAALQGRGFEFVPSFEGDPDHAFLHRIVGDQRTDHVHVVTLGGDAWGGYLLFRDYLRATSDAVRQYEAAKRDLAVRFAKHRDAYVREKQPIVEALMVEARAWQRTSR